MFTCRFNITSFLLCDIHTPVKSRSDAVNETAFAIAFNMADPDSKIFQIACYAVSSFLREAQVMFPAAHPAGVPVNAYNCVLG